MCDAADRAIDDQVSRSSGGALPKKQRLSGAWQRAARYFAISRSRYAIGNSRLTFVRAKLLPQELPSLSPLTEASGTAGPVQNRGMQILTDALCVCWPMPAGEWPVFLRC